MNRRRFLQSLTLTLTSAPLSFGAKATPSNARPKILILGGGIGGSALARALWQLAPNQFELTCIDRSLNPWICPGSNHVIAGLKPLNALHFQRQQLGDIRFVQAEIQGIHSERRSVQLADGREIPYDRLVVAPGVDFIWDAIQGYDEAASSLIPHAWKAGPQTRLLQQQLGAFRNGGTIVITVPDNPYRCPPGPYERASLMAHFLKRQRLRGKILILDGKSKFSKQKGFTEAWNTLYPGIIEWLPVDQIGRLERVDPIRRRVETEFSNFQADVLNVIPPQRAGKLAREAGLTDTSGWCPVDASNFKSSQAEGIYVIGDAAALAPLPKSAFSAFSCANTCALALMQDLLDLSVNPGPIINHCYSSLDNAKAISISGVYGVDTNSNVLKLLSGGESLGSAHWRSEGVYAKDWYEQFTREIFGKPGRRT